MRRAGTNDVDLGINAVQFRAIRSAAIRRASASNRKRSRMNRQIYLANAVLWATAIVASAMLGAPTMLTLLVLPSLATCALVVARPKSRLVECRS